MLLSQYCCVKFMEKGYICFHWFIVYISCILTTLLSLIPNTINNQYRGGDCHQAFLPHRECVCYDRCPRCCVELELDVNFDKVNQTRPDQEKDLPLTVTSRDLVSHICLFNVCFLSSSYLCCMQSTK